ncbi:FtsH protease regulator HflK [Anaerohalosphaera lusitana]|uniref:FtsH protease regulator HflK n=1 Tax=Anaerohalosphaera lusitana TaxID=1936003 RepID=A0A1U9NLM9_9BACT|nr:SPFH domain-containing protein [Anaerohalosphaera lusitana]AQT68852.1 FtsH protease regulator HflK [Anaerohalosphaera lusitana]
MKVSSKRAEHVSIAGLVLSVVFFVTSILVGAINQSFAAHALSWQILGGGLIWLVLIILFHQRSLAEQEKLDMAQMEADSDSGTIFQGGSGRVELMAVHQKRLAVLEKWFLPAFSVVIALYHIGIGIYLATNVPAQQDIDLINPQLAAVFMALVAFLSFLISRFATGMSVENEWRPIRAGGSSFLATAVLAFGLAVCFGFANFRIIGPVFVFGWVIPVLIIVLGVETAIASVLDFYRPRRKGEVLGMSFDSRLLAIFNEPGGFLHTFTSALDYQFGFKVSQTWFYRLLEKAIIPLFLFFVLTLYALSSIVIVNPGEQAIIEHFGSFENGGRLVGPGMTLKLPWPFDQAYVHPTSKIQQISVGFVPLDDDAGPKPLLWGMEHYEEEFNLLTAAQQYGGSGNEGDDGAPPIGLVRAAVPIQYRVNDLKSFMYNHKDAKKTLEAICYREVVKYAAQSTIETDVSSVEGDRESLLGAGRSGAVSYLTDAIQKAANEAELGVEIVFVGLQGVHPPPELAKDYEAEVGAVQDQQTNILLAQAGRNRALTSLAGSIAEAEELYDFARKYAVAKEEDDREAVLEYGEKLKELFLTSEGEIFKKLREAKSYAFEKATLAEATGTRFEGQLKAYQASPEIYRKLQRLIVLEEALQKIRKYVIAADQQDSEVFVLDLKEALTPGLMDMSVDEMLAEDQ